ncbi:hypothetical protein TUM20983_12790 [Mycobacterium antarcticum]|nr:hypothetical protein TUM20983_12790 [Mycolicibacterium sp. TUM20983]
MGVLDAFMSTWSSARETFGQGVPPTGERFDQSGTLQQLQTTVESAAPGSRWTGTAAAAYDTANQDHGKVFAQLAALDQRLGAQVTASAHVVTAGRQDLDAVRKWVLDAAGSVPAGKNREQLLMPIVQKGLGQLSQIVTTSNGDLSTIGSQIRSLGGEYAALGNQKFAPKEGPGDVLGAVGEDGKWKPYPEDMQELVRKALDGDQDAAAKVHSIMGTINSDQLEGSSDPAHPGQTIPPKPLDGLQSELIGQMQNQMKDMSMSDLTGLQVKLGDDKGILGDAMQVMSDPDVKYPHQSGAGLLVPGRDGWLPGGGSDLPSGVREALSVNGDFLGPSDPSVGYPGSGAGTDLEAGTRGDAARNLTALADIVGDGDSKFQQGSVLDHEMMARGKEWLAAEGNQTWGDDVVGRVFETAGRDTVVDHEMFARDSDFTKNVLTHPWQDDGRAASTLTDWIDNDAYSANPDVSSRAGETAHALAAYIGDHHPDLLNIDTGSEKNVSLGQLNPELAKSLALAMTPYVDDMAGQNLDSSSSFGSLDGDNMKAPRAVGVFSVLESNDEAGRILTERSVGVQSSFVSQFANSVADNPLHPEITTGMEYAGRLKGITELGTFNALHDLQVDANQARIDAHQKLSDAYDRVASTGTGLIDNPLVGTIVGMQSDLMKEAIVGPSPELVPYDEIAKHSSIDVKTVVANEFLHRNLGMPEDVQRLMNDYYSDGHINPVAADTNGKLDDQYVTALINYLSNMGGPVITAFDAYDGAYDAIIP